MDTSSIISGNLLLKQSSDTIYFYNCTNNEISFKDIIGWLVILTTACLASYFAFQQAKKAIIGAQKNTLLESRLSENQIWADKLREKFSKYHSTLYLRASDLIKYLWDLKDARRASNSAQIQTIVQLNMQSTATFVDLLSQIQVDILLSLSNDEILNAGLDELLTWMHNLHHNMLDGSANLDLPDLNSIDIKIQGLRQVREDLMDQLENLREGIDRVVENRRNSIINS